MRRVSIFEFPTKVIETTQKSVFFNADGQAVAFDTNVRRGVDFIVNRTVIDAVLNCVAVNDVEDEVFFDEVQVAFHDFDDDDVFAGWLEVVDEDEDND